MKTKENECCFDMRGFLSFLILFLLSKKNMNGQEISKEIEIRKGCRPSPGTIYPALKSLRGIKLIKENKEKQKIIYSLTKKGEKSLKIAKKKFRKIFSDLF